MASVAQATAPSKRLRACHCCGLVQSVGVVPARHEARCARCETRIGVSSHPRSAERTAALTLAALVLYPVAITLPVMKIERLGHGHAASIWEGMVSLLADGYWFVGLTILLFSVVAPVGKLAALLLICTRGLGPTHRARTYRLVEWIGRWGMLDVLLVAVLVAAVKLGDLVEVTPGPGVVAFGGVVLLSLIAAAVFDPHVIWEEQAV